MQNNIEQATKQLIDALKQTCGSYGLGNDGNEYKIIIQMFLYKYFNDKFGFEAKRVQSPEGKRLAEAEKWDAEYDKFTDDEVQDLFDMLPPTTPRMKPYHTIAHLYNAQQESDFSSMLDSTMIDIAKENAEIFSMATVNKTKLTIFEEITVFIPDSTQRDDFARSLMRYIADPDTNFEPIFSERYDFFSTMFEYLIKDYNKDGGGKYAEYYTPRSIALIMAQLLVGDEEDLRHIECYDPSAGSGTLLMALAHTVGEERCTIYSQDISQKSSKMLRLNLILNNLVASIQNILQGDTLLKPGHTNADGSNKQFDFIVSNPPFKLDFPTTRDTIASDGKRFWAGVPAIPPTIDPDKPKMKIFTCFIQHMINSLRNEPGKRKGRGAIVVPTGFITAKSGIEKKILEKVVKERIIYGVVSMPSNVFATTGTNVSVLFFDMAKTHDKVVLIDASHLGETLKDGNTQRTFLRPEEIEKIVNTFKAGEPVDDFCVTPTYDEIKEKGYSLSAGQYFDIKIDYVDITEEEFNRRMNDYKATLTAQFAESHRLENEIMEQLNSLSFNS